MIIKLNGIRKSSKKYKILCAVSIRELGIGKKYLEKERI